MLHHTVWDTAQGGGCRHGGTKEGVVAYRKTCHNAGKPGCVAAGGGGWHPHKPAGRWATSPTVGHVDGRAEDLPEYSSQSDALRTAVWPHEELGAGSHKDRLNFPPAEWDGDFDSDFI